MLEHIIFIVLGNNQEASIGALRIIFENSWTQTKLCFVCMCIIEQFQDIQTRRYKKNINSRTQGGAEHGSIGLCDKLFTVNQIIAGKTRRASSAQSQYVLRIP